MDELDIKGNKYISSKRASELTGYAKDYIGQLARAGKINGTRMGRAWYVEEASLLAHASSDPQSVPSVEQERKEEQEEIQESREEVIASPVHIRVAQMPQQFMSKAPPLPSSVHSGMQKWTPATYSNDDTNLVPMPLRQKPMASEQVLVLEEESAPVQSPISEELAGAVRIKILEERARMNAPEASRTTFRIAEKANKIKTKRRGHNGVLSLGALTAALAIFLFFSAGLFVSSEITLTGPAKDSTANVLVGSEYFKDVIAQFPPFAQGFAALQGFFGTLFVSFGDFISKGVQFLSSLFSHAS